VSRALVGLGLVLVIGCGDARKQPPPGAASTTATAAPAKPAAASARAVVFLGDSLTAGYGLAAEEAVPARIEARVAKAGLDLKVINGGRSGDTSAGGLARLDWYLRPEVGLAALVVNLGSNDALRGLSLAELEKNLGQIIGRARAARPAAPIFLVQLDTFPNMGAAFRDDYRTIFPRVAAATGATLVPFPLAEVVLDPKLNIGDGVHPSAAGTERLADAMWPVLEPAFRRVATTD
jgi:acyl-CoA thioesterase-1